MTKHSSRQGFLAVALVALLTLALAGCGGDGDQRAADGKAATPADSSEVVMRLVSFRPTQLTVPAGTTVSWKQTDAGVHTVTSGRVTQGAAGVTPEPDGTFDSGNIDTDGTFEFTFEVAGTFPYFCTVHPATMRAEVRVT